MGGGGEQWLQDFIVALCLISGKAKRTTVLMLDHYLKLAVIERVRIY